MSIARKFKCSARVTKITGTEIHVKENTEANQFVATVNGPFYVGRNYCLNHDQIRGKKLTIENIKVDDYVDLYHEYGVDNESSCYVIVKFKEYIPMYVGDKPKEEELVTDNFDN